MFGLGLPENLVMFLKGCLDLGLALSALSLIYYLLIKERRTQKIFRGLLGIFALFFVSENFLKFTLFSFVLERIFLICAFSVAFVFQSDLRRVLELLGQGEFGAFFKSKSYLPKEDSVIDEIIDAVKELSQNRIGALIVIETFNTIEERVFLNPGIRLNASISKELLQSIFHTKSLLHDGAVFIRGSEIISAAVILPLSERSNSKKLGKLGTRHRAAMGLCEKVENCVCVVVSEETGSISLGEKGILNRPLTSTKLKDLLEEKLSLKQEREVVTGVSKFGQKIGFKGINLLLSFFKLNNKKSSRLPSSQIINDNEN